MAVYRVIQKQSPLLTIPPDRNNPISSGVCFHILCSYHCRSESFSGWVRLRIYRVILRIFKFGYGGAPAQLLLNAEVVDLKPYSGT